MSQRAGIKFHVHGATAAFMAEVEAELDKMIEQEAILAELEQIELAQIYKDRAPETVIDGVGPQILAISRTAFIHYKAIEQLDFHNKKDLQWLVARHPHMKAPRAKKYESRVGYTGGVAGGKVGSRESGIVAPRLSNVRERITYAEAA